MKAIVVSEFGDPEVLEYTDVDDPTPGPDEVSIRLYAAGVNPSDVYTRTGTYNFNKPLLPYIPGSDGAGVVDAIGEGVEAFKVGDRVYVNGMLANKNIGTYAERCVCQTEVVFHLPDEVSYEAGASLGVPGLAAYRALFQRAKVRPGETVLIHGASGGVGILAVQMASAIGAKVIGTASSQEGRDLVKKVGANHAINHIKEDDYEEIESLTEGQGPDVIIEMLANVNLVTDLNIIAKYGRIVVVGNRGSLDFDPRLTMAKEADILGMASWNFKPEEYQESLQAVQGFLRSGILDPIVGDQLPLSEASKAHEEIIDKKSKGKMVLIIE